MNNNIINSPKKNTQDLIIYSFVTFIIILYFFFNIKIHMHESYLYALGAEKIIDIKESHLLASPWLRELPPFGSFHPNHPGMNFLVTTIKKILSIFNLDFNAISIIVAVNTIAGLIGAYFVHKILKFFEIEKDRSILFSLLLLMTGIYWYSSKSAESYITANMFTTISIYHYLKYQKNLLKRDLTLSSFAISLGIIFHSLYFFVLIFQALIIYFHNKEYIKSFLKSLYVPFISIITFYIFPIIYKFNIWNPVKWLKIFFFYGDEMGVWTYQNSSLAHDTYSLTIEPIVSGVFHMLYSFVEGMNSYSSTLRIVTFLILLFLVKRIISQKAYADRQKNIFIFIFIFYFVLTTFILHLPYDITYWIFVIPSLIILSAISFKNVSKIFLASLVFIIGVNTFIFDIYPKYMVDEKKYFHLNVIHKEIQKQQIDQVIFLINDTYAETSYLNYYGIIWQTIFNQNNITSIERLQNSPKFYIDVNDFEKIYQELEIDKKYLIVTNKSYDKDLNQSIFSFFNSSRFKLLNQTSIKHHFNPTLDKTSEMEHDIWYKFDQVGKSWNLDLFTLIKK